MNPDNDARLRQLEDEIRRLEKLIEIQGQNNKLLKLAVVIRRGLLLIAKGIATIFEIGKHQPDSNPKKDDSA